MAADLMMADNGTVEPQIASTQPRPLKRCRPLPGTDLIKTTEKY